ncbi:MAG TPA: hypothetical protein VL991_14260 [Terracidiphilus sp.]|nr:hypothetical protein [Terracidiphilus sp.]
MRTVVHIAVVVAFGLAAGSVSVRASSPDSKAPDQQSIEALEARASQAQPREQCFLYAQLVHQMTELSVKQYAEGNVEGASGLLKKIQLVAQKIHLSLANNDKRLKNAEILLNHTAFRLNEMLHASNYEDRQLVQQTLAQVNNAQNEAMMEVFHK